MFTISARSIFELISTAQMVATNAQSFIAVPSKLNRKDLQTAVTELTDIVLTISGEAFEGVANDDKAAQAAAIRQELANAMQQQGESNAQ